MQNDSLCLFKDAYSFTWVEGVVNYLELTEANTRSRLRLEKPSKIPELQQAETHILGHFLVVTKCVKLLAEQIIVVFSVSGGYCDTSNIPLMVISSYAVFDHELEAAIEDENFRLFCVMTA